MISRNIFLVNESDFFSFHTMWKNQIFTVTWKIFREINSEDNSLFSRIFVKNGCSKIPTERVPHSDFFVKSNVHATFRKSAPKLKQIDKLTKWFHEFFFHYCHNFGILLLPFFTKCTCKPESASTKSMAQNMPTLFPINVMLLFEHICSFGLLILK